MNNEKLENLIQDYLSTAETVIEKQKPFAGIFGFKGSIRDNDCHEIFLNNMKTAVGETEEKDAYETVKFLLEADTKYDGDKSVKLMLTAIQGLAIPLVPRLTAEQKKEFTDYIDRKVPKRMRLPVQEQLYKELCK